MHATVLAELRLLTSAELDSRSILTVVLAGDDRLCARLETPELLPLASRLRVRLRLEALAPADLRKYLQHLLAAAGNPRLLTDGLQQTLCEHAAGNLRVLINLANELLLTAASQDLATLDDKLYLQVFTPQPKTPARRLRP
jgi:type II secretory pathway predicted ATPase ExeA